MTPRNAMAWTIAKGHTFAMAKGHDGGHAEGHPKAMPHVMAFAMAKGMAQWDVPGMAPAKPPTWVTYRCQVTTRFGHLSNPFVFPFKFGWLKPHHKEK